MRPLLYRAPPMKGPGPRNPFRHGRRSIYPEGSTGSAFARIFVAPAPNGVRFTDYAGRIYVNGGYGNLVFSGFEEK